MAVILATKASFDSDVLKKQGLVVVDFYADWCGPCKMIAPVIEELASIDTYEGRVSFVKVDVDKNPELASKYSVFSIPTFIFFKDGEVVSHFVGVRDKTGFEEEIKKNL